MTARTYVYILTEDGVTYLALARPDAPVERIPLTVGALHKLNVQVAEALVDGAAALVSSGHHENGSGSAVPCAVPSQTDVMCSAGASCAPAPVLSALK